MQLVVKEQELLLMVWSTVLVCRHYSELQYSCQKCSVATYLLYMLYTSIYI